MMYMNKCKLNYPEFLLLLFFLLSGYFVLLQYQYQPCLQIIKNLENKATKKASLRELI